MANREELCREIFELNEQIRVQSFALVGPKAFPPDLTMRQLHVLLAAAASESVTVHQVAEALEISAPTASGLVDRLADKGLVTKVEDSADRRVRHVQLTPDGEQIISQLDSAYDRLLGDMLDLLEDDELAAYRDGSNLMLSMIERARANQGG